MPRTQPKSATTSVPADQLPPRPKCVHCQKALTREYRYLVVPATEKVEVGKPVPSWAGKDDRPVLILKEFTSERHYMNTGGDGIAPKRTYKVFMGAYGYWGQGAVCSTRCAINFANIMGRAGYYYVKDTHTIHRKSQEQK